MGRRSDIPWDAIRAAHEQGASVSELSRRFTVKRDTISARIKRDNWSTIGQIAEEARSNVINIATKRAVASMGPQIEEAIASGLLSHAKLEAQLLELAETTISKAIQGKLRPGKVAGEASDIETAISAVQRAIAVSREINGRRAGQPSVGSTEDDKKRRIEFFVPEEAETA